MRNPISMSRSAALLSLLLVPVAARGGEALGSAPHTEAGTLWAWGGSVGSVEAGSRVPAVWKGALSPVRFADLRKVRSVAAGYNTHVPGFWHCVALTGDGTVWNWGWNGLYQLGDGTKQYRDKPIRALTDVRAISAGFRHTLALKLDGTVWEWGLANASSIGKCLGREAVDGRKRPFRVTDEATAVAAGGSYSMALKADGTVWTWGYNHSGQLGDGTTRDRWVAAQVQGLPEISSIAAGGYHCLVVAVDGEVWGWGHGSQRELGDGAPRKALRPIRIPGLDNVAAVAAGNFFSLALRADGTVWAWGNNGYGQLGDGTKTVRRGTPAPVQGLARVKAISAGDKHSLALDEHGAVWAWGGNYFGQLGDGTTEKRRVPFRVPGLKGAAVISAGYELSLVVICEAGGRPKPDDVF